MLRSVFCCMLICLTAFGLASCARRSFPDVPLENVQEFSNGTASVHAFKARPSAQELYDVVLAFYDSLDSAATSCDVSERHVSGWSTVDGRATDIDQRISESHIEYRYASPDKELVKMTGDDPEMTAFTHGKANFSYLPRENRFVEWVDDGRWKNDHSLLARWLNLLPEPERPKFAGVGLGKDSKVKGTPVYVLELRLPYKKMKDGYMPPQTRRFYLGKSDLLPRKIEVVEERDEDEKRECVPENGKTMVFSGFACNAVLSPETFPKKPPKGSKPFEMPVPASE